MPSQDVPNHTYFFICLVRPFYSCYLNADALRVDCKPACHFPGAWRNHDCINGAIGTDNACNGLDLGGWIAPGIPRLHVFYGLELPTAAMLLSPFRRWQIEHLSPLVNPPPLRTLGNNARAIAEPSLIGFPFIDSVIAIIFACMWNAH